VASSPQWVTSRAIPVSWGATPAFAPVTSYDVKYRRLRWNGNGKTWAWRDATTATSGRLKGDPGYTYCFKVLARDADGNTSPWAWPDSDGACTAVPVDDRSLVRSGGWAALRDSRFYRSTALRTRHKGATLRFRDIRAPRVRLVATTCPTCGTVKVYRGHHLLGTISLSSPARVDRALLTVEKAHLRGDTITIKVVSSGRKVIIDGVAIHE